MTSTHSRAMTLEQFLALPEQEPALEFADGRVTQDERKKCRWYVANGVLIALFVHHPSRTITRFTPDGEQRLAGDDRIDLDTILPGFTLTAAELFATLRVD